MKCQLKTCSKQEKKKKTIQTSKCQIVAQEERATNSRAVKVAKLQGIREIGAIDGNHIKSGKNKKDREKNTKKRKVVGNR